MIKIKIYSALTLIIELILTFLITYLLKNFIVLVIGLLVTGITGKIIDIIMSLYMDKMKQDNHDNLERIAKKMEKD